MFRLAVAIEHPIQYHAPLYSYLARDGRFELKIFFMSDRGARPFYEKFTRRVVRYDNPILEGYAHLFMNPGEPRGWWKRKTEFINFRLGEELLRFSPQAVYFHGYMNPSFWWAIRQCRKRGIRMLLRAESEDLLPRPFWRYWLREAFLKLLFPRIDGFLTIGTRNREFFLKRNVPIDKLFFVPYSVDNGYFRDGCSPAQLNHTRGEIFHRYGLKGETRLFIYTHKFRPTMRPLDALRAFCDLVYSRPIRAALILCGDGQLRPQMERLAAERGKGRIFFTGYLSQAELRKHLLASDVMVNPACEPWGCSLNEGLASGLAIISSDKVGGWPDMVLPGVNGYVYPCGEVKALSQLMERMYLLSSHDLTKMQEESLSLSRTFSFATCADGLEQAMRILCSKVPAFT